MTTRRDFLRFSVAAPFVDAVVSTEATGNFVMAAVPAVAVNDRAVESEPFKPSPGYHGMGELLCRNLEAYEARLIEMGASPWPAEDRVFHQGVAFRFAELLLQGDSAVWGRDLSAPFDSAYPNHDATILDRIRFAVIDDAAGDVWYQDGENWFLNTTPSARMPPAEMRKMRSSSLLTLRKTMEDLRAYHGIDAEAEICESVASNAALEVLMEIRLHAKKDKRVSVYAVHLPPFCASGVTAPADQGGNPSFRIRYAKSFEA